SSAIRHGNLDGELRGPQKPEYMCLVEIDDNSRLKMNDCSFKFRPRDRTSAAVRPSISSMSCLASK
ncbi:hypothetical protein KI387_040291, partial [Taxus chinensis]